MPVLKNLIVFAVGLFAAVYLVYPSFGLFELIPDAVPFFGSIDEAGATVLLLGAFRYYGVDLSRLFQRDDKPDTIELPPTTDKRK